MPSAPKLNHVGIAVKNLSQIIKVYEDLGFKPTPAEILKNHMLKVVQLPAGSVNLELMEPLDSTGPVAKYISRKGSGLHHLAFEVQDFETMINKLKDMGYNLIDYYTSGLNGNKIAFLHPKSTDGTLIELLEKSK